MLPEKVENKIKLKTPEEFDGTRGNVEAFLSQCDLYIYQKKDEFVTSNRMLFICSYLRGNAYEWVKPHLDDYIGNDESEQEEYTRTLFKDFKSFKIELRKVYGTVDQEHIAERKLQALRQTGAASVYAAEFGNSRAMFSGKTLDSGHSFILG